MRWVFAIAVTFVLVAPARADRVFVPSLAAGLAIGGSTLPAAPLDAGASYTSASLAWEDRGHDGLSIAPELGALGVWHGTATPVGLVGVRLDADLASTTTLSFGVRAGSATDTGGMHPAADASICLHAGRSVQLGVELAVTGWHATMMMGGDAMQGSLVFVRLGVTLSAPL
jgi:hypothetical protein